jgi:hypothetical protein
MKKFVLVLCPLMFASVAMADLTVGAANHAGPAGSVDRTNLGNAYDGIQTFGNAAQDFEASFDQYDIWVVSDFTTSQAWNCDAVSAVGFANAAVDGSGANFRIYNGLPWAGGSIVMSSTGGYDHLFTAGNMGATFNHQLLPAGSYYMVFQAVRTFGTSGQSYVYQTSTGNNNDYQWNPGGGFGQGTFFPTTNQGGAAIDVNWQLVVTPEPTSLLLLAAAGLLIRRR